MAAAAAAAALIAVCLFKFKMLLHSHLLYFLLCYIILFAMRTENLFAKQGNQTNKNDSKKV
jgi:hypothetical protein